MKICNFKKFEGKKICFFTTVPREILQFESYTQSDIRILKELGFEVVVCNTFSQIPWNCDLYFSWWASGSILPLIISKLSFKPIITIAGGNEAALYKDSISAIPYGYLNNNIWKQLATKIVLKLSNKLLVVSNFMLDGVMKIGAKNPIVVHNCVDTNLFIKSGIKNNFITSIFNLEKNTVILKRGENFIRSIPLVLKYFPNQNFLIIGRKNNDYNRLYKLVLDLKIEKNITFIDQIPNNEVQNLLASSILYVQISDTETFGVAIAEAMSCEVPVLVSNRGAIPEVVGENGIYVDNNNIENIAKGIIRFLKLDEKSKKDIGKKLRVRICENFSYEIRKQKIFEIIKTIL